jgi:ArsR family transcriptional regulator
MDRCCTSGDSQKKTPKASCRNISSCLVHMEIRIFVSPYVLSAFMITPTELFKCLADETRVRATLLIADHGELCVCELMCALDDSQPKISRHLAQLRSHGLLLDRRQGQWVYYRLNPDVPEWVREILRVTSKANADWLKVNSSRLRHMDGRPVRETTCA